MKTLKELKLPFIGLKDGVHDFNFGIDDSFFNNFPKSLLKGGDLNIVLRFDKKPNFYILDFTIQGTVKCECDRCLQEVNLEVLDEFRIFVKFDDELAGQDSEEEKVMYISWNETHLDLSQLIYEFIHLSTPLQKFCEDDVSGTRTCKKEVLDILNKTKKDNDNVDPRWAALKNLKK